MFATNNASSQAQASSGASLPEIQTQSLGFLAIAGESKIRLLPEQWPSDSLPKPTSSLLSIASRSELLAAAAPSGIVIGTTDAVRNAFTTDTPAENNIKPFTPQLTIQTPRISQVAFSSDESCLVISAEQGGGLAVYQTDAIKRGSTEPAFQIGTNGVAVRVLLPNPFPDAAHMIALVLAEGQLMIADLKTRSLADPGNGPILKHGVSCVSWSAKGKQLVAGLGNGTCVQMDPSGNVKAEIPRPPELEGDQHVSAISWLDNDHFLAVFTPSNFDLAHTPDSTFFYISTEPKRSNFMFQKLQESPCGPFGMNRSPPHHFISRLRQFPPNLDDTLFISSTASGDIGLITCSKTPLSADSPNTANTYTTTSIGDDARRAQLPTNDAMLDTSPIGMALDLSSRSTVPKPLPMDEMESSATPLPNLMVLNNEGLLSSWWFVYAESVKQRQGFPGLTALAGSTSTQPPTQPPSQSGFGALPQTQSPWAAAGSSNTTSSTPFAQRTSTFGSSTAPTFGGTSAFGSSSGLGANQSPWATGPGAGTSNTTTSSGSQPVFGSSTNMASPGGFGAVGGIGNRSSPWGSASQTQQPSDSKPANPFSNNSSVSPFAGIAQQSSNDSNKTSGSLFGSSVSSVSGFASLDQPSKSIFGKPTNAPPPNLPSNDSFPSTVTIGSSFGGTSTLGEPRSAWATPALSQNPSDAFSARGTLSQETEMTSGDTDMDTQKPPDQESKSQPEPSKSLFGTASSPFKVESSFKSEKSDADASTRPSGFSLFDDSFSTALNETKTEASTQLTDSNNQDTSKVSSKEFAAPQQTAQDQDSNQHPSSEAAIPVTDEHDSKDSITESPVLVKNEPQEDIEDAPLPPDPGTSFKPSQPQHTEEPPAPLPPDPEKKSTVSSIQTEMPSAPLPLDPTTSTPSKSRLGQEPPEAPLPPDPISQTPSKQFQESDSQTSTSPESTTTTPLARTQPADVAFDKPVSLPASATPLRSNRNLRTPSTTPIAPPPTIQSPTRQLQAPSPFSTTPTAPPPSRQLPSTHSSFRPAAHSSTLSRVEESPVRSDGRTRTEVNREIEFDDKSDLQIQQELQSDINPTRTLAPFLAHQDYVGRVPGHGIEAQIEKLYRDIVSMVDTLGLNARSLKAFIEGHDDFQDGGITRDDLESRNVDDWTLAEVVNLDQVEAEIEENLDEERLHNVGQTVTDLLVMQKELEKLRSRQSGLRKLLAASQGTDTSSGNAGDGWEDARKALSLEQSLLLTDLRKQLAEIQKSLAETEDSLTLLRAKVVGIQSTAGGSSKKVPTFEGIINTIFKMTRMVEQRSGDVDLLESQLRKLQRRSARGSVDISGDLDDAFGNMSLGASLMSSQIAPTTPPSKSRRHAKSNGTAPGAFQLSYDSQSDDEQYDSPLRRSIRSSASKETSKTKKLISPEEVDIFNARLERRAQVLGLLKKEICKRGTLVQGP